MKKTFDNETQILINGDLEYIYEEHLFDQSDRTL